MTTYAKLLKRFLAVPADFRWDELVMLLTRLGFSEKVEKGGSYRMFVDGKGRKLFLHAPHPGNILKKYAIRKMIKSLTEYGLL